MNIDNFWSVSSIGERFLKIKTGKGRVMPTGQRISEIFEVPDRYGSSV
jgi:hypothetical protein